MLRGGGFLDAGVVEVVVDGFLHRLNVVVLVKVMVSQRMGFLFRVTYSCHVLGLGKIFKFLLLVTGLEWGALVRQFCYVFYIRRSPL